MKALTELDLTTFDFLLIDDNKFIRRLLFEVLKAFGVRSLREADNAEMALGMVVDRIPDIILCDWVMSPIDGLGFLKRLREMPRAQRVPVIMITGHATTEHVSTAMGEGADSYIVKPFKPSTLMDHIVKAITTSQLAYL